MNAYNMKEHFEVISKSITGTSHSEQLKGNEDACAYDIEDNFIVACVADGCGSAYFSSMGSNFAVNLFIKSVKEILLTLSVEEMRTFSRSIFLEKIRIKMITEIVKVTNSMGCNQEISLDDYFTFTITGTIITQFRTDVFSIGDGYYSINGIEESIKTLKDEKTKIKKDKGDKLIDYINISNINDINYNPYLIYSLNDKKTSNPYVNESTKFRLINHIDTISLNNLLIGTDGIEYLKKAEKKLEDFNELNQFFDKKYFNDPRKLDRTLNLLRREVKKAIYDDTTMILIKRK